MCVSDGMFNDSEPFRFTRHLKRDPEKEKKPDWKGAAKERKTTEETILLRFFLLQMTVSYLISIFPGPVWLVVQCISSVLAFSAPLYFWIDLKNLWILMKVEELFGPTTGSFCIQNNEIEHGLISIPKFLSNVLRWMVFTGKEQLPCCKSIRHFC